MYKLINKVMVRRAFRSLSAGDIDTPLKAFADDVHFHFAGDSAMACDARSKAEARRWFERALRLFPGVRFDVREVVVNGFPWNTTAMTFLNISAELPNGRPYRNEGMQLIRIKWGKIVEDLVYEDTQRLANALGELAQHGVDEAAAAPIATAGRPA